MFGEFRELMAQAYIQVALQRAANLDAKEINHAVSAILQEINTTLPTLAPSEVLTVNLGEEHNAAAQIVAQKKLCEGLTEQRIAYGFTYEDKKTFLSEMTNKYYVSRILHSFGYDQNLSDVMRSVENDPKIETYRLVCAKHGVYAPLTRANFHDFLLTQDVPFAFNDAALIPDPQDRTKTVLDFHDPNTRNAIFEAIDRLGVKTNSLANIGSQSPLGMLTRNIHAKRTNNELSSNFKRVRVLLDGAGGFHVAGKQDHPFETSMAHLYQEDKKPFLGVLFSPDAAPRAERARANGANVLHLPLSSSYFERPRDWDGNIRENDDLLWREAEYLERLSNAFHEGKSATEYKNKFDRLDHDIAQSIKRHVHPGNAPEIDQPT